MIPNQSGTEAVVSGNMETSKAKIKMSSHMVDLLSSRVYTDKVSAVIRELSCNAQDAQVAAGVTTPIEVHLPTKFEPHFEVKDNGIGLCHEDVMNLYVTYGESTKQESNDAVGFMGIGSKSPFSYVDAFTTTSIFEGTKRIYSVYKNNGIPEVVLLSEEATTEGNGLAVKVAVKECDIYNFETSALKIYFYFDTLPKCNKELNSYKDKLKLETEDFLLLECPYSRSEVSCVMGQVKYSITESVERTDLAKLNVGILVLKFDIGDIQPAASREHLSNDEKTEQAVKEKLIKVGNTVKDSLIKEAQTKETVREAYNFLQGTFGRITEIAMAEYKGKTFVQWKDEVELVVGSLNQEDIIVYSNNLGWRSTGLKKADKIEAEYMNLSTRVIDILVKDLKSGGIQAFKETIPHRHYGFVVNTKREAARLAKRLYFTEEQTRISLASEIHTKPTRSTAYDPVIELSKSSDGSVCIDRESFIDLKNIKVKTLYVDKYVKGYRDHNGNYCRYLTKLENMVAIGLFDRILVASKTAIKKAKNSNLQIISPELLEGCITKEMVRNRALGKFKACKLDEKLHEVFKDSRFIRDNYSKLNDQVDKFDVTVDAKLRILLSHLPNNSKKVKLVTKVSEYSIKLANVRRVLIEVYPFLNNFNNFLDGAELKYIKCLVKAQDEGKL